MTPQVTMAPVITAPLLRAVVPSLDPGTATLSAQAMARWAPVFGVTTRQRLAHYLAQWALESGFRADVTEHLERYTPANLTALWPARFPPALAAQVAGHFQQVGDIAYGSRMGNRPGTHDGSLFAGHGPPQLTGRANHLAYGARVGQPLGERPELLLQYGVGWQVASAYWQDHGCNAVADRGGLAQVPAITRLINGGLNGLPQRQAYYRQAAHALGLPG